MTSAGGLGLHDAGHAGVATGCGDLSLRSTVQQSWIQISVHKKAHASLHKRVLIGKERQTMPFCINYLQKNN